MNEIIALLFIVIMIGGEIYNALVRKKVIKERKETTTETTEPKQESSEGEEYKRYLEELKRRYRQEEPQVVLVEEPPQEEQEQEEEQKLVAVEAEKPVALTPEVTVQVVEVKSVSFEDRVFKLGEFDPIRKAYVYKEVFGKARGMDILRGNYFPWEIRG